ncbi:EscU/YscU/HrcU family type III secretion system export apparatus switch protein [Flavobacterium pectinovorum]|uniref:ABC transporter permease n=1 Tax=Flavobacterium pectinovorum TaxID=29533 RepID=A0A502EWX5_9FLAO|nr:EscU/YscU/HrcU family type III secretion system export apparatus switch protein [Flavobacterium pectinovorum]TPG42057.1 ABC transporter permease [Flavobacterium pectinovorum]
MKPLSQLFSLKKTEDSNIRTFDDNEEDREQIRITYYQSGFAASIKATGRPIVLKACLQNLYMSFEDQCRKQKMEQDRLKQPYKEEQEKNRTELKKCEAAIGIYEKKEQDLNDTIDQIKNEMIEVKRNPDKYGIEDGKGLKAQFYIGLFLLLPITLYVLVFYISASYSAFFKEFANDSLTAAIFDANALTNSFKASWLEGVLVTTIPFVFMGLGYVIHMVQKGKGIKNIFRMIALFTTTFLFDALLAYQIEKKIYEFNKTTDSSPYNLNIALGEAEFWMIIFAGFVVYIIWGLVFDFVMKEFENIDKIRAFIRGKKENLINLDTLKIEYTNKINDFKEQLITITGKISELQSKIDGFVFPVKEYLHYHHQYKEGWFQAINTEIALPHKEKVELLENCDLSSEEHLSKLNLVDPDFQHLVYSKN